MAYEVPTEKDYKKAEKLGIPRHYVNHRIFQYGWSLKRAITAPVKRRNEKIREAELLAEKNGISKSTFFRRVKEGMELLKAASIPTCKYKAYQELREENGISLATFYQRVNRGMNPYEAATKPLDNRGKKKKKQIS